MRVNIDNAIELLDMYNPIDSKLEVLDSNLSISNITYDALVIPAIFKSAVSHCPINLRDSRYRNSIWSDLVKAGRTVKDLIDEGKIDYKYI